MDDGSSIDETEMVVNKEEYKVIDECVEEETPTIEQNSQTEVMDCSQSEEVQQENAEVNTDGAKPEDDNVDKPMPMEVENDKSNDNAADLTVDVTADLTADVTADVTADLTTDVTADLTTDVTADLTADVNLEQLETQKEVTDEDVMHHLDVIENIELDPETFGIDRSMEVQTGVREQEEQSQDEEVTVIDEEVTVISEEPVEEKWYEKKIAEKNALLRERLSKLGRVLAVSYPHYEKWLERIEKIEGSPICKIDAIRRCSLKNPHTNRWKFMCSKKQIHIVKEEDNPSSKKGFKMVWSLEPMGVGDVNTNNPDEFPPFVMKAVKIFEDFLQTTISAQDMASENPSSETSTNVDPKKDTTQDKKQQWLWLLVRCNSTNELMLFATGKDINRATMDRLKQTYESGPGKNCNVKSLYCKSLNKCDDKVVTTFLVGAEALDEYVGKLKLQLAPKTNFWSNAAGASNVARAVADMLKPTQKTTVLEIGCGIGVIGLTIASKCREVIGVDSPSEIEEAEMTCELNGIYNVSFIKGSASEVVNKISAARDLHNKNRVTYGIINANTNMGRAIEVMTCLRKITSLRRIVMVTTLTKQSVRAILELARPIEDNLGHPFMPVRSCVVDTLPNGPHFEAVILMERRLMHRLTQPWFVKMLEEESKSMDNTRILEKIVDNDNKCADAAELRKNLLARKATTTKSLSGKRAATSAKSGGAASPAKDKAKLKRDHSPEVVELPKKVSKKVLEKSGSKPWQQDVTAKKKNWLHANPSLRINPLFEKKAARENKEQADLREKLSGNRIDADLIQRVNESREILEAAKEKLSGPSPTVDPTTAKEIKNVLSLVLDQTSKLQSQLPRSVWDRIAPPETTTTTDMDVSPSIEVKKELDDDPLLKGRFVQEIRAQDIVITAANKEYLELEEPSTKSKFKKYHNLAPLEPDMVMPVSVKFKNDGGKSSMAGRKTSDNRNRQQNQNNSWNRNKNFEHKNRWNKKKFNSPAMRRQNLSSLSPPQQQQQQSTAATNRFSPKRPLLSPPRHPCSPPRRHFSPNGPYETTATRLSSPSRCEYSPQRRQQLSPLRQQIPSPSSCGGRRQMTPPPRHHRPFSPDDDRPMSAQRPPMSPIRRHASPPRPLMSPSRRQMSPPIGLYDDRSARELSPLMRRPISPVRYRNSPERRPMSPVDDRARSPRSRDTILSAHQPSMRLFSPHRMPSGGSGSPTRGRQQQQQQQMSPRRQSPQWNRYGDEWDIPSRGAVEQQSNTWKRSVNDDRQSDNFWRNEKQQQSTTASGNWQLSSTSNVDHDRYRKSINQEKSWDVRGDVPMSSHGGGASSSWGAKQSHGGKPPPLSGKESFTWQTTTDNNNRWSSGPSRSNIGGGGGGGGGGGSGSGGGGGGGPSENWTRGRESLGMGRKEQWMDKPRWEQQSNDSWNQGDKEDWNDLPEDARDPWGDDGGSGFDNNQTTATTSSGGGWLSSRDTDKGIDPWKSKDNWQTSKSQSYPKPLCQNSGGGGGGGNDRSSANDSRWLSLSDANKKLPLSSTNWQGSSGGGSGGNVGGGTWQSTNYGFQSQRSFVNNPFHKDRR